jgi:hypothetical protein
MHIVDSDLLFPAVTQEMSRLGAEIDELLDGGTGLTATARFKISPEKYEGGDHGTRFEIEMVAASNHGPDAVSKGSQGAERYERVHICSTCLIWRSMPMLNSQPSPRMTMVLKSATSQVARL